MKYNYNQICKTIEKLFNAGFTEEKQITSMQLEDLTKIPDFAAHEVSIIIDLKRAIKEKRLIRFLSEANKQK